MKRFTIFIKKIFVLLAFLALTANSSVWGQACDYFTAANSTTVTGWTEQVGDWQIYNNTLQSPATAEWNYITRDGSTQTNGCVSLRATYTGAAGTKYIGAVGRYSDASNYLMAKIQDNGSAGYWDSYFIYENGSIIANASGLNFGTDVNIALEYNGTAISMKIDTDLNGTWDYTYTATSTTTNSGLCGVGAYNLANVDNWCYGSTCITCAPPANETCAGATAIYYYNDPYHTSGVLGCTDDCSGTANFDVFYTFTPQYTGSYTADMGLSAGDTYMRIFSGSCCGTLVASDDDSYGDMDPSITLTLTAGTTYWFECGSWSSSGMQNSPYNFNLVRNCTPPANETCSTPTPISYSQIAAGFNTSGTLGCADDCAGYGNDVFFSYDCTCTGSYTFDMRDSDGDTYMRIYSGSCCGTLVASDDDSYGDMDPTITVTLTAGTTYWIECASYTTSSYMSGTYYNLYASTTCILTPGCGNTYLGNITPSSCYPQDANFAASTIPYWSFNATAGTTYNFSLGASAEDTYLHLYNDVMTEVATNDDSGPFYSGSPASLSYTCTTSGTYYITASHWTCNTITTAGYLTYWSSGAPYENTSLQTITPSIAWQNQPYAAGSMDVYRFYGTAGLIYDFSLCSNTEDSYIQIYNSTYDLLADNDDSGPWCTGVAASISFTAPATDYYIVQIRHLGCSGFTNAGDLAYRVQLACTVGCGDTPVGNLNFSSCSPGDAPFTTGTIPYWSFNAVAGNTYNFATSGTTDDTYLHLYDVNCTEIATNDDGGPFVSGVQSSLSWTCTTSGMYIITCSHYTCSTLLADGYMTYWMSYDPYGSTSLQTITPTASWQNQAYTSGNLHVYKFNATAGSIIDFSLCSNTEDSYLRIYNTTYDLQFSNDDNGPWCSGYSASATWTVPATGYYIVEISHLGCSGFNNAGDLAYRLACSAPIAPSAVMSTPSFFCGSGTAQLSATSAGNTINWWDAATGGTLLGTSASGANFPVAVTSTTTYYAEAQAGGGGSGPITTLFAGGNQFNGNMFDVNILNNIIINDFAVHSDAATYNYEVYYKTGTWVGYDANPSAWTLVGSANNIVGNGSGVPTLLNLNLSLPLTAGQTYAFYITNTAGTMYYTDGTAVGNVYTSNADMQILEGWGGGYPFTSPNTPRVWNGTIYYSGTTPCVSGRVPVTVNVCPEPAAPTAVAAAPTSICAADSSVLNATSAGNTIGWYDAASGGNLIGTSNSGEGFSVFPTTTTTYYAEAQTNCSGTSGVVSMPAEISTYSGDARGYWFVAPTSFTITGVNCLASGTTQNIAVVRFVAVPPVFSTTTNDFTTLFLTQGNTNTGVIPCSVAVNAGDIIGVLGTRDAAENNSYGPTPSTITIAGSTATIERLGMQYDLSTTAPQELWTENANGVSRVELTYTTGSGTLCTSSTRTPVSVTVSPVNTIALSSAAGTDAQTQCVNTAITNITYATTGATGATITGLPAGVSGGWASNVVTISGTPTVVGTYTYTINLPGGCGATSTTGTITLLPNNTITLSSAAGTNAQTQCINTALTTITYATTGATGATVTGLPAGVSGSWAANTVTINGTPTNSGAYTYTVSLAGGCTATSVTGTITVSPVNTITLSSAAGTNAQTVCNNTAITNITYSTTAATGATITGLPTGISGNWSSNVVTISGTPTATGTYTYTVSLNGGCGSVSTTGTVTVNTAFAVGLAIQAFDNPTCTHTVVNFTSTPTNEGTAPAYQWYINSSPVAGATNSTYSSNSLVNNDLVQCQLTSNLGCTSNNPAMSNTITMSVNAIPMAEAGTTATYSGTPLQIGDASNGPGTISWAPAAGLNNATIAQPLASPSATTTYTLTVDNNGCILTDTVTIYVGTGYAITGKTRYLNKALSGNPAPNMPTYNGAIYNINKVIVILKNYPAGTEVARDTSDGAGVYNFSNVANGSYMISYDKYTADTMQVGNEVNAVDVALLKYLLGHDTLVDPSRNFTAKHRRAANVDNSIVINAVDVARAKAKIGSPYDPAYNFPKGNWVAFDTLITVSGSNLNLTLKTVCYGDYDASSSKYKDSTTTWGSAKSFSREIIHESDEMVMTNDNGYFEIPLSISTKMNELSALGLELNYPASQYKLVSAVVPNAKSKNGSLKINASLQEIIASDDDLLVTDIDGVIRVVYATTNHFDVAANDQLIVLGFRAINDLPQGELDFFLSGTGVIADQYGVENEETYLSMPKVMVQGTQNGFEFTGYPNPFNGEANLTYSLPENGSVKLKVYNAIGELVSELVNETQQNGRHMVTFTPENLPAGMYTFKLEFSGLTETKCLVLKMIH